MRSVPLKSGNTLEIQEAAFEDAIALQQAVAAELAVSFPSIKVNPSEMKDLINSDLDVGLIASPILKILASKEVYRMLWACFRPCLYNGRKMESSAVFEDPKSRLDYYPCVIEIFKENVIPFMKGLDLSSLAKLAPKSGPQK